MTADSTPRDPAPALSVIIPVLDGAETIRQQLEALDAQRDAPAFEVIVVDNGSTDGTADVVRHVTMRGASLRLIAATDERGASYARNVGAAHARAALLMFCDADDVVSAHWVAYGWRNFQHDELWSGMVVPIPAAEFGPDVTTLQQRIDEDLSWHPPEPRTDTPIPMLQGGDFGVTRRLFAALGGFDQSIPSSFEDLDLAYRARKHGVEVRFAGGTRIAYRLRGSREETAVRQIRMARAKILIAQRHGVRDELSDPPWPLLAVRLAAAATRMPFRRRADRDWTGLRGRALFTWGVFSGTVMYRYLRRIPAPRPGAGLTPPASGEAAP
ncbi:glycosyltransferase family 2 protein [Microbacterium sp. 22242]|uniref:glycosyltransferase family 2 protein n=1 Tax=Microbacterium sp. 22242 TaxID=3453896 RepID=UPI003F83CFF8